MKCPVCKDVTLLMSERHGVEIDYCPECRGVWLDRGELDKIIERAHEAQDGFKDLPGSREASDERDERRPAEHDERHEDHLFLEQARFYKKRKKKQQGPISALSDIMDIFGGE